MSIKAKIYEQRKDGWAAKDEDLESYLRSNSKILKGNQPESTSLHYMLEGFYSMPNDIWTKVHWESNGYYGCSDGRDEDIDRHDTWFRFLVKQLFEKPGKDFPQDYDYSWDKLGFFTTWKKSGRKCMLCLDCPDDLVKGMRKSLETASPDHFIVDPYAFHQVAIRGIVNLYDKSIWRIRDVVRTVEKAGSIERINSGLSNNIGASLQTRPKARKPEVDYDHLHEAARHVIHSTETLQVSTQLLEQIILRHKERLNCLGNIPEEEKVCMRQVGDNLMFYYGMIHAFKCRSESMQARHQNEIQLAFNTVAQYHSHVAAIDSAAMKVIAALTAAFLPATFVSAIFSMSFFNNGGDNGTSAGGADGAGGDEGWSLSDKFWIYWAFAVPLTVATIILLAFSKQIMRRLGMV
ncbi:hypothetical protein AOL_s00004g60 [Orbilia oligospora ATCC 24927]|uniref:CorA metal ion transporter n=2 Tax=Orbilia oligospora TaxID=2813651 RepID=G1WXQ0_ARTOA|nr:hypothetical protein AOL_s00004g60 [Orbilia oligospora ATCC 24927]EGX54027.1 hypothetical protein AOL_s00004g60 [Orbilia oligospora ATCC 24927]KAF3286229.1 hypothetical protein TWF970_009775 [Orbilia oligospora]